MKRTNISKLWMGILRMECDDNKERRKRTANGAAKQINIPDKNDSDDDICVIKEVPAPKSKKTINSVSNGAAPFRQDVGPVLQLNRNMAISGISYATMTLNNGQVVNGPIAQAPLRYEGDRPVLGILVQQAPPLSPVIQHRPPLPPIPDLVSLPAMTSNLSPPPLARLPVSSPSAMPFNSNIRGKGTASIQNTRPLDLAQLRGDNLVSGNVRKSSPGLVIHPAFKTTNSPGFGARKIVNRGGPPVFTPQINVGHKNTDTNAKIQSILAHVHSETSAKSPAVSWPVVTGVPSTSGRSPSSGTSPLPNSSVRLPAGVRTSIQHKPAQFYLRSGASSGWEYSTHREQFQGRFKCHQCSLLLPTNISMLHHGFAHMLSEPLNVYGTEEGEGRTEDDDADVEDFSRCHHCLTVLSTPHQLTLHIQQVHVGTALPNSVCYICSMGFQSDRELLVHLHHKHSVGPNTSRHGDAPYYCKICKFRSSLFVDIKTHFIDEHSGTSNVLCPVCLDVFDCKSSGNKNKKSSVASTKYFINHLNAHLDSKLKCDSCQLRFVKSKDLEKHTKNAHVGPSRGLEQIDCGGWNRTRPIALHEIGGEKRWGRKLIRSHQHSLTLKEAKCVECTFPMTTPSHYKNNLKACGLCGFVTNCVSTSNKHKEKHKGFGSTNNRIYLKEEVVMQHQAVCSCGFATNLGNKLACHMEICDNCDGTAKTVEMPKLNEVHVFAPAKYTHIARLLKLVPTIAVEMDDSVIEAEHKEQMIVESRMKDLAEKSMICATPPLIARQPSLLMHSKLAKRLHRVNSESPTKRQRSHSSSGDETESTRAPAPKRRKLDDIFVSRRSTADQAGSNYKMYREKAIIAGEYAKKFDSKVFRVKKDKLSHALIVSEVSSCVREIVENICDGESAQEEVAFESFLSDNIFDNFKPNH